VIKSLVKSLTKAANKH